MVRFRSSKYSKLRNLLTLSSQKGKEETTTSWPFFDLGQWQEGQKRQQAEEEVRLLWLGHSLS